MTETTGSNVQSVFESVFGVSATKFARKLIQLHEAGQAVPIAPIAPISPVPPSGNPNRPNQQPNAVSKLATKAANDPNSGNSSVDSAITDMDDNDKREIKDLQAKLSQKGMQANTVNDLITSLSNVHESKKPRKRKASLLSPIAVSEKKKKNTRKRHMCKSTDSYSSGENNGPGDSFDLPANLPINGAV